MCSSSLGPPKSTAGAGFDTGIFGKSGLISLLIVKLVVSTSRESGGRSATSSLSSRAGTRLHISTRIRQMDRRNTGEGIGNARENADSYFHPMPGYTFSGSDQVSNCSRKEILIRRSEMGRPSGESGLIASRNSQ
jgi:hypothetical protein